MWLRDASRVGVTDEYGLSATTVHPCPMKSPASLTNDRELNPTAARWVMFTVNCFTVIEPDLDAPVRFPGNR
jgi:hypothetical protein